MAESSQKWLLRNRPPRVKITYDVEIGDAIERKELPRHKICSGILSPRGHRFLLENFGPLPPEVDNLLQIVAVKQLCRRAGIDKIDAGPKGAMIGFRNGIFARPDKLIGWITQQAGTVKVRPDQKLVLMRAWDDAALRLAGMKKTLTALAALVG